MILFFSNTIEDGLIRLDEDESKHCLKVLRLGRGDVIHVTDGKGNIYDAEVTGTASGHVTAAILKTTASDPSKGFRLHIAIAPTKNSDRFEWFLEKAAEIGIDEITPLFCMRSERTRVNDDRLKRILVSAVKQSLKTRLPLLRTAISMKDFLKEPLTGVKLIATCISGKEEEIQKVYTKAHDAIVLIGPEGDFTDEEIKAAIEAGYMPVSLGESRLRTETAGVYVTAAINLINRI